MDIIHAEIAWVPMCTNEHGSWFWSDVLANRQKDAREKFAKYCLQEWSELRKEGWRIVRVRLTTELHG